jgi:hypothetical protein
MADKKLNVFSKTEQTEPQADNSDLDTGVIKSTGVGLKTGEITALQAIADTFELARNSVMRIGLRWFIAQYRAGKIDLSAYIENPPPPKKRLRKKLP